MALLSKSERRHFPAWDHPSERMFQRLTIDVEACDGCRLCTLVCPANVLAIAATQHYGFVGFYRQLGRGAFLLPRRF